MERMLFPGLTALFVLALAGCNADDGNNDGVVDSGDTSTNPDDTDYVTYMVTLHASIDNVVITEDPPAVCLHKTEGETGQEDVVATGTTTEVQIPVDVPEDGVTVRPWVGPSTAALTGDGHRIYERGGFQYIHEIADFLVNEDCEDTVELNVMPAREGTNYDCVADKVWNASGEPANNGHHEFVQQFVAQEGKYFSDPDAMGFDGLFGTNEKLMTTGTTLGIHNPDSGDYVASMGSEVRTDSFTLVIDDGDATTTLICVQQ